MTNLNFKGLKRLPVIRQSEAAECGLACLGMIAGYHGLKTDITTLRRKYSISMHGMSLRALMELAEKMNLTPRPIKVPIERIKQVQTPAILHWDLDHFVVLKSVKSTKVVVIDPGLGERSYTFDEFSDHFTGVVLELSPTKEFEKKNDERKLKLLELIGKVRGIKRNLLQALILSIVMQAFVLASPFYLQVAVDEVLPAFDGDLLLLLALGFGAFTLINVISHLVRGYVLIYFGNQLTYQMEGNLFTQMLRLPVEYFEKRQLGDLLSRYLSMRPIRDTLSEGLVAGVIDGIMAITTLILMFVYSPLLAFISFGAWFLFFALRMLTFKIYHHRHEDVIVANALVTTIFMESARGITSLKLFGGENDRDRYWRNKNTEAINESVRLQKLQLWYANANTAIMGLDNIIIIYLLVSFVMDGAGFSVGMIFAFMAYKRSFVANADDLVARIVQIKTLRLHLDRVGDIMLSDPEPHLLEPSFTYENKKLEGKLECLNLKYRYSSSSPEILKNINLVVEAGTSVALVGHSGCGKTTLLKIMSGLFTPTDGTVLVDGVPLKEFGLSQFRQQIGVVMQEDDLFAGSIAENIAFFDSHIDMVRVKQAAKDAMIHDDIISMSMGYESLVGDMGSALSGGQKQRVMLARAFYRNPKILFMDEGTAHLDVTTEHLVNQSIKKLGITRIIVAHRPETIRSADIILEMHNGEIISEQQNISPQNSEKLVVASSSSSTLEGMESDKKTNGINAPAF